MTDPLLDDDLDLDGPVTIRRRWPMVLLLLVLLGLGAVSAWYFLLNTHTAPHKFVVAVQVEHEGEARYWWDGDDAAVAVASAVADRLEELGLESLDFKTESKEALKGAKTLEEVRDAASRLGAGLVITGVVKISHSVPLDGEMHDFSIRAEVGAFDVEEGVSEARATETPLEFFEWGRDASEAIYSAADRIAIASNGPLASQMTQLSRLARLAEIGDELTYDEAAIADRIQGLFRIAGFYERQLQERLDDEKNAELRYAPMEQSTLKAQLLGDFLAQESYIGQAADGRVVLMTEPHYVEVNPEEGHYNIRRESERLVLMDLESGAREILFEHFNFYSSQHLSENGETLVAILENRGRSKWMVSLSVPEGEVTMLFASSQDYYSSPSVSPNGKRVAYWFSHGRRAPDSLEVVNTDGTGHKRLLEPGMSMSYPRWSDDNTLYLSVGVDRRDSVMVIDVDANAPRFLLGPSARPPMPEPSIPEPSTIEEGEHPEKIDIPGGEVLPAELPPEPVWDPRYDSAFPQVVASRDGTFLIVEEKDGYETHIGRYDLATDQYTRLASLDPKWLELSPDGKYVALKTRDFYAEGDPDSGDYDIVLVPTAGGDVRSVTLNDIKDGLQGWSNDSQSVFVIQSSRDPASRRYSARVYRYQLAP